MTFFESLYIVFLQYLVFNISYYLTSLILFIMDYFDIFKRHKIQDKNTNMLQLYKKVIPTVLLNTFIVSIPGFLIMSPFVNIMGYQLSLQKFVFDIFMCIILVDIFFYTTHRIFHLPRFYKYHKKHHEIHAPIGASALYMSKADAFFGNLLPTYLPLFLISAHPVSSYVWISVASFNTVLFAHSGFKWLADFHDYHHMTSKKNYGANIFMDRLFGTLQQEQNS